MIRVVAFDLDDTLWHVDPVIIRAEQKLARWLRSAVPDISYDTDTLRVLRNEVMSDSPEIAYRMTELRLRVIERALLRSDIPDGEALAMAESAMEIFLAARNEVEFFEGALEAIEQLAPRYILGALSNGNADIRAMGLAEHFTFAFSAEDVGAPKPEPDLFHRALSHIGCAPGEMVYVGDDPVKDVDAANRVGLRTVWLRNDRRPGPGESEADIVIDDITRLPEALTALEDNISR